MLFAGAEPFTYEVALGRVARGRHRVEVVFDPAKSPPGARRVRVRRLAPSLVPATDLVARHAPILYGRDLPEIPGRYENAVTDVPLLAYHTRARDADGTTTIEYTTIWSNEDGGTNTPALMARWGRTTDIEWIYRVVLDARGRIVREEYQAPNHETKPFTGAKEGRHPLLVNVTANNNLEQVTDPGATTGYRFFADTARTLPAGRAREAVMDAEPWTYRISAEELAREGELEPVPDPDTPLVSDQRNYLFAEVDKDTSYPAPPAAGTWVGTALEVQLRGGDRWYRLAPRRARLVDPARRSGGDDGRAAAGHDERRRRGDPGGRRAGRATGEHARARAGGLRDPRAALNRGFLLDDAFLPQPSFLAWTGDVGAHAVAARGGHLDRRRSGLAGVRGVERLRDLADDRAQRRQRGVRRAGRVTSATAASSPASGTKTTPPSRRLREESGRRVTPTPAATSASRPCGVVPRCTTRGR